jgi:hypothetical protein
LFGGPNDGIISGARLRGGTPDVPKVSAINDGQDNATTAEVTPAPLGTRGLHDRIRLPNTTAKKKPPAALGAGGLHGRVRLPS